MQRTLLIASLACALALPVLAGDRPALGAAVEKVATMRVEGTIAVDETGQVRAHTVDTQIDPQLLGVIERAVAQWTFAPPTVDGQPARVKSAMRVTLVARQVEAGTEVSVDNVLFFDRDASAKRGEANAKRGDEPASKAQLSFVAMPRRPVYPRNYNVNGIVTVAIRANPDGTVAEVFPTQCSLYFAGASPKQIALACKQMADIAIPAIRTWKMGIELNGDAPTPRNLTGTLSLEYKGSSGYGSPRIEKSGRPGNWRPEARTQFTQAPWLADDRLAQRVGTSDVSGSEMLPQASPLQLLDRNAAPRAL